MSEFIRGGAPKPTGRGLGQGGRSRRGRGPLAGAGVVPEAGLPEMPMQLPEMPMQPEPEPFGLELALRGLMGNSGVDRNFGPGLGDDGSGWERGLAKAPNFEPEEEPEKKKGKGIFADFIASLPAHQNTNTGFKAYNGFGLPGGR